MAVAKEQIRQIISENNISSIADVYALLKDSFKDILQELMEAELMQPSVMKKIIKETCRQTIKEMDIPPKLKKPVWGISDRCTKRPQRGV